MCVCVCVFLCICYMTLHHWIINPRRFEVTHYHLDGPEVKTVFIETSGTYYPVTHRHIAAEQNPQAFCSANLKTRIS
jgi:hypothetical protein